MTPEQREKFEAHAKANDLDITRNEHGDYACLVTDAARRTWQAALASDTRRSVEDIEDVIAASPEHHNALFWVLGTPDEDIDEMLTDGRKLRTTETGS